MTTQTTAFLKTQKIVKKFGHDVTFNWASEQSEVETDDFGDIIGTKGGAADLTQTMKCFPIRFNPSDKDKTKAGLTTEMDVIVWSSKKTWTDLGLSWEDLETLEMSATVDGQGYKTKQKNRAGQFGTDWRYITFALSKFDAN